MKNINLSILQEPIMKTRIIMKMIIMTQHGMNLILNGKILENFIIGIYHKVG